MKQKIKKSAAKKEKEKEVVQQVVAKTTKKSGSDDFSSELISQLNKESGSQIAWNLESDNAPTNIKRWISTGSRLLDGILSNRSKGGLPEGRIVEISGGSSTGKSHIVLQVARNTQRMGGVVVYIDTENATNLENLVRLGVNVKERFVFVQTACTEEVFAVAESAIMKARAMKKDVPVTIIWDSLAATSPRAELEGEYDQNTIGLQARVVGKGLRKITNIIGNQNVLFVIVNQLRAAIGVMFGDNTTTPGGMALPYTCSTRIRITSTGQSQIKDKNDTPIGIKVKAKTIKNKVTKPFRECEFKIIFGEGIDETEEVFDLFREYCDTTKGVTMPNGDVVVVSGGGAWKNFLVTDNNGVVKHDVKFYKPEFSARVINVPLYYDYVEALFEAALVIKPGEVSHPTMPGPNPESLDEIKEAAASGDYSEDNE
jgi:recombination protein RecA